MVAVEELHACGQLLASRLDDQVVVVAHEAERVAAPVELHDGHTEKQEKEVAVVVVEEDRDPPGTPRSEVEDPVVGQFGPR